MSDIMKNEKQNKDKGEFMEEKKTQTVCPYAKKCGGCQYQGVPYSAQLKKKQNQVQGLLKKFGNVKPVIGMKDPYFYRNKVHAVFDRDRKGNIISGIYEAGTHRVVSIEQCLIEDKKSQEIIRTIRGMLKSFKIKTYDEDTGYGLLRHVLVRRGFSTGEVMVVLVVASPIFPSKNNFVKALRKVHPEISTVVLNINDKNTSMVLGEREIVLYGKGFIRDTLCGKSFRISPKSFYQVNSVQTEILYGKAVEFAGLTGKEKVIDAYCGIGTISLNMAKFAKKVYGVEIVPEAIEDAKHNASLNDLDNLDFEVGEAEVWMEKWQKQGIKPDVIMVDPPRKGLTSSLIQSAVTMEPKKIVYVSCNPATLVRDIQEFMELGYQVTKPIQPVDQFPQTTHVESVTVLEWMEND